MNVLIVGGGGREHALAWRLAQSDVRPRLWCAPGNPGTAAVATNIACKPDDVTGLVALARDIAADLVVVGPEAPLALGLADRLRAEGVATFGPGAAAARLEASKSHAKAFCDRHGVPTAGYAVFDDPEAAAAHLAQTPGPYVLKADGLAAGKGVVITDDRAEAERDLRAMFGGRFGAASSRVVIEEFMRGEEASFFVLIDETGAQAWAACQDHKRAFDGDEGPNTGGMGAYSPTPALSATDAETVKRRIVDPVARGLASEGLTYRGVLYVGLMMTADGPKVVEFNVRFGDPECQVLMMRAAGDPLEALSACARGRLGDGPPLAFDPQPAVGVTLAARGYPDAPQTGGPIAGLERAASHKDVEIFHAGTARGEDGVLRAAGGRVLTVCARGDDLALAVGRAYEAVDRIDWPDGFHRRDIAARALART